MGTNQPPLVNEVMKAIGSLADHMHLTEHEEHALDSGLITYWFEYEYVPRDITDTLGKSAGLSQALYLWMGNYDEAMQELWVGTYKNSCVHLLLDLPGYCDDECDGRGSIAITPCNDREQLAAYVKEICERERVAWARNLMRPVTQQLDALDPKNVVKGLLDGFKTLPLEERAAVVDQVRATAESNYDAVLGDMICRDAPRVTELAYDVHQEYDDQGDYYPSVDEIVLTNDANETRTLYTRDPEQLFEDYCDVQGLEGGDEDQAVFLADLARFVGGNIASMETLEAFLDTLECYVLNTYRHYGIVDVTLKAEERITA